MHLQRTKNYEWEKAQSTGGQGSFLHRRFDQTERLQTSPVQIRLPIDRQGYRNIPMDIDINTGIVDCIIHENTWMIITRSRPFPYTQTYPIFLSDPLNPTETVEATIPTFRIVTEIRIDTRTGPSSHCIPIILHVTCRHFPGLDHCNLIIGRRPFERIVYSFNRDNILDINKNPITADYHYLFEK